jgi:hypothetical protein
MMLPPLTQKNLIYAAGKGLACVAAKFTMVHGWMDALGEAFIDQVG